jgi:putative phage-type endonuclease
MINSIKKPSNNKAFSRVRSNSIGGSDIPVIMGVNPYKNIFDLWDEKVNPSLHVIEQNDQMLSGTLLEAACVNIFKRKEKRFIVKNPHRIFYGDESFFSATPDRLLYDKEKESYVGVLEIKCTSNWDRYKELMARFQLNWYMGILKVDIGYLHVQEGTTPTIIPILFDAELFERMKTKAIDFWRNVEDKTEPEINVEGAVQGSLEDYTCIELIHELNKKKKEFEAEIEHHKNQLFCKLENKEQLFYNHKIIAQQKTQIRFNSKQFQIDHPDLYNTYRTMTVNIFEVK